MRDRANDADRDLVLKLEDVVDCTLIAVGPQMTTRGRVYELSGYAKTIRRLADAAFKHIAHTQFAADLFDVDDPVLVSKARIARDDEHPADTRQGRDNLLDDPIREIVLFGIA